MSCDLLIFGELQSRGPFLDGLDNHLADFLDRFSVGPCGLQDFHLFAAPAPDLTIQVSSQFPVGREDDTGKWSSKDIWYLIR